jgi:hypothetical protein
MVSFKRVFNLSFGRVVYRVEKLKVLMEDIWEKDDQYAAIPHR